MPTRFSLVKTLEYLLDTEAYPPWLKSLFAIPMIVLFIWLVAKQQPLTKEEATIRARQLSCRALITRKSLNVRGEPVLEIEQGTLLAEEIDWGKTFFSAEVTENDLSPSSREAYLLVEQHSLIAYAAAGDSLMKRAGDLSAQVKRGDKARGFYFHNL